MEVPLDVLQLIAVYLGELRLVDMWEKVIVLIKKKRMITSLDCIILCSIEELGVFDVGFVFLVLNYLKGL